MNGRERLLAALSKEPTDHVPVWLLFPYHKVDYYVDVRNHPKYKPVFEASKKYAVMLNRRSLAAAPHAPQFALRDKGIPLFESSVKFYENSTAETDGTIIRNYLEYKNKNIFEQIIKAKSQTYLKKPIDTNADLEFYCSLPIETDKTRIEAYLESKLDQYLKEKKEFGDQFGVMMLDLGEPVISLYLDSNLEEYAIWSLTHNDLIVDFLDRMMQRLRIIYRWCLERDLADVYFLVGSELASPPLVSKETFNRWILPYAKELIEMIHGYGKKVIQHYHGQIKDILGEFAEMAPDGLHTIEAPPVGNCTFTQAYQALNDKITLIGNIQYDDFGSLTTKQMVEQVTNVLDECKGRPFILSPTAGPFDENISDRVIENYLTFLKTAWEYNW